MLASSTSTTTRIGRRAFLATGVAAAVGAAGGLALRHSRRLEGGNSIYPTPESFGTALPEVNGMPMRAFGSTGVKVSEVGFGAWGIGGTSYGTVERQDALDALARAEELGCNFVDTAAVYGVSEEILGEFLQGRRARWVIATKFTRQPEGLTATVERQLQRLRTDVIDFYQIHWYPRGADEPLLDEMSRLKQAGKIRFCGVSLYGRQDIDDALANPMLDGFQVAFSLLDPDPFLSRARAIGEHGKAVIIRSALHEGFLTGKFRRDVTFPDSADQRSKWTREQIETTVDQVERLRFLEAEAGTMVKAAAGYPLSFPQVSTVIMGTKSVSHASSNFGEVPGTRLSQQTLARISDLQYEMRLGSRLNRTLRKFGIA
jgi:aryl-alcohol dehydrogenase-like predicted oxidoreductase